MKTDHDGEAGAVVALRLWTYRQALKAVPYLRGIVRSLREQWLELRHAQRKLQRIDARQGLPGRQALIEREELVRDEQRAETSLFEALTELNRLGAYCLDPVCGLAMMPFRLGDELCWFVFDLFSPSGLEGWRYSTDPLAVRRPLVDQPAPTESVS